MDDGGLPEYDTIKNTCWRFGLTESKLYEALGEKKVVAKKLDKRTLIDQRSVRQYIDNLPTAEVKPSQRRRNRIWQSRFVAELSAARTHRKATAVLEEYNEQIAALSDREREDLLARAQDIIAETAS